MKQCTWCKLEKDYFHFYKWKHSSDGYASQCKECRKTSDKKRCNTIEFKIKKLNHDLKKLYGLDIAQYENLVRKQVGVCKICKQSNIGGGRLHVDHDHKTGIIRGLLCNKCNRALGLFNDDIEILRNAFDYLERNISILR